MMETEGRTLVQGLLETQVIEELRRQTEVGRSPNSRKPPPPEGHKEEWHSWSSASNPAQILEGSDSLKPPQAIRNLQAESPAHGDVFMGLSH